MCPITLMLLHFLVGEDTQDHADELQRARTARQAPRKERNYDWLKAGGYADVLYDVKSDFDNLKVSRLKAGGHAVCL